ncbi:hypothetical protein HPB48_014060 [Haemaphysalis longicornis]|uniref:Uncharacterized protein n=1 Tax=Haemaphysalis longicornis TaxID=44386 RepID=A0A9J6G7Q3_HAELO|nr:hypothetical protein HPB48_014060 [Haemaphysalis longicornis]
MAANAKKRTSLTFAAKLEAIQSVGKSSIAGASGMPRKAKAEQKQHSGVCTKLPLKMLRSPLWQQTAIHFALLLGARSGGLSEELEPHQRFNADEAGRFWQKRIWQGCVAVLLAAPSEEAAEEAGLHGTEEECELKETWRKLERFVGAKPRRMCIYDIVGGDDSTGTMAELTDVEVGKFYELYHMDAVIGVEELGLVFMKGEFAHSGFPEIAYGRYSEALIQRGYKVARVEQTETPRMMEERCRQMSRPSKFERVVRREICRITSRATRTFGAQDGQLCDPEPSFLLAIVHREVEGRPHFGICFVDTSVGKFHLGQFEDDQFCSQLRTAVSHYPPAQVLHEAEPRASLLWPVLEGPLHAVPREVLRPGRELWDAAETLRQLREGAYFEATGYPEALLVHFIDPEDPTNLTPRPDGCLALKALGACVWYLRECLIEEEVLTMRSFERYVPPQGLARANMVLDGVCLQNLEVLRNASGGTQGTLLATMDCCCTPFGRRLFQQWLCAPPCRVPLIEERQRAVADLLAFPDEARQTRDLLRTLPDLERLLARIHSQGLARKSGSCHPDQRAILYEDTAYNKRKIANLLQVRLLSSAGGLGWAPCSLRALLWLGRSRRDVAVRTRAVLQSGLTMQHSGNMAALEGFQKASRLGPLWEGARSSLASGALAACLPGGEAAGQEASFPDLSEALAFFEGAFDHELAKREGRVTPARGVDPDYDRAMQGIQVGVDTLKTRRARPDLKAPRHREKPLPAGARRPPGGPWSPARRARRASGSRGPKGGARAGRAGGGCPSLPLAPRRSGKEKGHPMCPCAACRRCEWERAVRCLSQLDCLLSLAQYSGSITGPCCTPRFLAAPQEEPSVRIQGGRHPCLLQHLGADTLVPNDLVLGHPEECPPLVALITGPNMGGKSTLMRQAGLLLIIAHMGARVPADVCELTLVDRIFTRLGASDRITSGEIGKLDC